MGPLMFNVDTNETVCRDEGEDAAQLYLMLKDLDKEEAEEAFYSAALPVMMVLSICGILGTTRMLGVW